MSINLQAQHLFKLTRLGSNYSAPYVYHPNSLYVSYQFVDMGVGLRYDYRRTKNTGIYLSGSYGNFNFTGDAYIHDHIRFVAGPIVYMTGDIRDHISAALSAGISYNHYGSYYFPSSDYNHIVLNPISMELGITMYEPEGFNVGIRIDPIKWESVVDFGWRF